MRHQHLQVVPQTVAIFFNLSESRFSTLQRKFLLLHLLPQMPLLGDPPVAFGSPPLLPQRALGVVFVEAPATGSPALQPIFQRFEFLALFTHLEIEFNAFLRQLLELLRDLL